MRACCSVKAVASLSFLLVVALAIPGCGGPLSQADHQLFLEAHRNFQSGNLAAADAKFTQVISRNQSSDALSELCYFRGLTRLKQGRRNEAREDFRRGATARGRELTQIYSAVALANLDFDDGNDASAASLYAQALDHPVKDLQTDAILYRLAVSLQRLGRWDEADRRLAKLLSDYDDSPFAAAARRRFQATHFAIQAGAFASRSNADAQAAKLRADGYPVTVAVSESGGKALYVVTVGRFRTYAEASSAASRLRAKGYTVTIKP